jgi:hypothetical protein
LEYRGKSGEIKYKIKTMTHLTKRQEAVLLGTILGDGFLQKTGPKNARLRLEHGAKQKEYVVWKGAQFPKLFLAKPRPPDNGEDVRVLAVAIKFHADSR